MKFLKGLLNKVFKKKIKQFNIKEVFTPSTSAKLTFVERKDLDSQINKALLIPGMQLVVYGHSGSGKTTIIQNILSSKTKRYIVTNCILDTSIGEIILDAFDKLNPYYTSEKTEKDTAKIGLDLKSSYLTLESTIKSELTYEYAEKKQRLLPTQLTPQRLAEFLGAAEVTWIIEDFHKVAIAERQKLSQILKIFVDVSNRYPSSKTIAIGAVGTAREIVNYDSELNNRIAEIHVPLMSNDELEDIMIKGENLLNVDFEPKVHKDIIQFSSSLASICHHLCFSMCYSNKVTDTQLVKRIFKPEDLRGAILDYLKQNSDSFKETLDRALKSRDGNYDRTKPILSAFCISAKQELSKDDILNYKNNKNLYGKKIIQYLNLLTTVDYGEIIRFDENSGMYFFSNPFLKAYASMQFSEDEKHNKPIQLQQAREQARMEEVYSILKRMYFEQGETKMRARRTPPNKIPNRKSAGK